MIDAGLSGKVVAADTKAYSGPARSAGTTASSKGGFFDELSKASSQKNVSGDDQNNAVDVDEGGQEASELQAEDGRSLELSEDPKAKPIIDISAAGLRKATDQSGPAGTLNSTMESNIDLGVADSDSTATELLTAAKSDKAEQLAKATLGALSDNATNPNADEAAALQQVGKAGLGQAGTSAKLPADAEEAEDSGKGTEASDEDLEAVLSLLGGNTTVVTEDVDAALAEAMADRSIGATQPVQDTMDEAGATDVSTRPVSGVADDKTTAKTAASSPQTAANAVAQETSTADQAFRAVRADGKYEPAAVSARQDNTVGVETKAAASDPLQTVTVLDSRRYLAPADTSNAANIAASMMGDSEWASAMRAGTETADATAGGGRVLNTLKIQMTPIDLGNVTAILRLTGDELTVSLVVESSAAYRKLSEDQNEIVKTLRAQGFSVDQVQISIVSSDKTGSDTNQSSGQNQFSGQQSAQQGGQGGATNNRSQDTFSSSLGNDQSLGVSSDEATATPSSADGIGGVRSGQLYL